MMHCSTPNLEPWVRGSTCPTEAKQSLAALDEATLFNYPRSAGEHRPLNSVMQAFNPTL